MAQIRYGATKTEVSHKLKEIETEYTRTGSLPSKTKFGEFAKLGLEDRAGFQRRPD